MLLQDKVAVIYGAGGAIGGGVGIALVSTVLVSRTDNANAIADPAARQAAVFDAFQSAFVVIAVLAGLGALVALVAFPRVTRTGRRNP